MQQWAESNIVIPDGPYKGERFRCDIQPFSRLFFGAVDTGLWERIAATGPTQTGKSLICHVIPLTYHLFAVGETSVAGITSLDMVADKWSEDILPVIEASPKLRELLPVTGEGGRGGRVKARVRFRNGSTLRFLTGGGKDKSRAGFTARILAITEVDGMDESGTTSRETDKVGQMEGRLRAYLKTGTRTYLECTVSTRSGRIWLEYINGTESRIALPCPHCHTHVTPEREHLLGWQDAQTELEAREAAAWSCPACAALWSEEERYQANLRGVLVHRGQEVTPEGQVVGPIPQTRTLGFRWTAVNNHFATAGDVAADEWNARRSPHRDNAEKKLRQFVHAIPWDPPEVDLTPLDPEKLISRVTTLKRGVVPADCIGVMVGVDTGKRMLHWVVMAVRERGGAAIIDYNHHRVESDRLGIVQGLIAAFKQLHAYFSAGWRSETGQPWAPSQVWIDSGYADHTDAVYEFCQWANAGGTPGSELYRPSKGHGEGQPQTTRYHAPSDTTEDVPLIGREYHFSLLPRAGAFLVHINSDTWKSAVHQALVMPVEEPLALTLFASASFREHDEFARQITAEKLREKFIENRGTVYVWERHDRQNHYLDASYEAFAGVDFIWNFRQAQKAQASQTQRQAPQSFTTPDGRPFLVTER
jgi:phage terminase large subunit GpA-like protein